MNGRRTIVFFPEGAYGPTNNCVGIGDVLRRRGHRVVFIVEESFAGRLEAYGFEERLMRLGPPPTEPEVPGQFWKDFIRDTAPEFRRPTIDQLSSFIEPTWRALVEGAMYVEPRLREIFDEVRPDVIVEDNVVAFPAVTTAGVPWARIVSCNPGEVLDADIPPVFSGYAADVRGGWDEFRIEYRRTHAELWASFDAFVRDAGAAGLPNGPLGPEFIGRSPFLDLTLYPAEVDYPRAVPLDPPWHRLDSCVRSTDGSWQIPEPLASAPGSLASAPGSLASAPGPLGPAPGPLGPAPGPLASASGPLASASGPLASAPGPLVYLSLGSLGSADVGLMQRLIDLLGRTRYRVIVSMGPQHELLTLAPNMVGAEFLPQPAVLPKVDVVITHGGNNTTTECLHFGKPMVVLPLFWDQYDNAQRMDELGLGVRLRTYVFEDGELEAAIERLLADAALHRRLAGIAARLQAAPGTVKAADLIERLAITGEPILRDG
jgi:UDP:flavonoid glycosyltransferase YjiC (YdhE family)